uniref:Uncharacterized protein n=1 Tax=Rousettus aegyptiacus TaxID=9407 RepID=A0A7J8D6K5_ROUAE|nr:hypothetical protein HJG63_008892 [Rousettus aegyptiacus]
MGHQVGLEFCQINIQGSITSQGCSEGGYNLTYRSIHVSICRALKIEVSMMDVIDASANFINGHGFQVYKHCHGHMLASACLTEEGVEGVISSPPPRPQHTHTHDGIAVTRHLAIRLDAMFKAVELPAGMTSLNISPANAGGEALTHGWLLLRSY